MSLSPKQRGAIFSKNKKPGMTTKVPSVPHPSPKMLAPLMPDVPIVSNPDQVDKDYIGKGRAHRFSKIRKMFGM